MDKLGEVLLPHQAELLTPSHANPLPDRETLFIKVTKINPSLPCNHSIGHSFDCGRSGGGAQVSNPRLGIMLCLERYSPLLDPLMTGHGYFIQCASCFLGPIEQDSIDGGQGSKDLLFEGLSRIFRVI